jgi:pyruvate formate lyase activating enzyme
LGAITYGEASVSSLGKVSRPLIIDRSVCTNCGECTHQCHAKALTLCGTDYTVEEAFDIVAGDLPFYERSVGGVTISGGEPLCQLGFTTQLLRTLKEHNIHTALDTTGYAPEKDILSVLPYTDLFLYDLKHMDSKTHLEVIGVPNESILSNARLLAQHGGKLQIRIPLITGINDSTENITATAKFCAEIRSAITVVQLLPFHDLGSSKYPRIGRSDKFSVPAVSQEKLDECCAIFASEGIDVIIH